MDEVDSGRVQKGQTGARQRRLAARPALRRRTSSRSRPTCSTALEQNRTVEIEVELDDAAVAAGLLPGTSADVEVILSARDDVLRVPTQALLEGGRVLVLGARPAGRAHSCRSASATGT